MLMYILITKTLIVGDVRHKYYDFLKTNDFDKYKRDINFLKNKLYLP